MTLTPVAKETKREYVVRFGSLGPSPVALKFNDIASAVQALEALADAGYVASMYCSRVD